MSLPQPATALGSVCSSVWNNTLYTYSASAFQALELTAGANWTTLAPGESVSGGVCVGSTPGDPALAGLYVVGGTSANASYTGLQKFTYATGAWTTITPETLVTQSRIYHGATYVNSTDSIVMYAGNQDGSASVSQQTFTIQASAPYGVVSYQSTAPAAVNPYLVPWSATQAMMIGGSTTNLAVMLFDPSSGGWVDSGASLASAMTTGTSGVQVALVTGDDGSKNLYTFDETVSPNQVARIVLVDGAGAPVPNAAAVKRSADDYELGEEEAVHRRATPLIQSTWPAYNATLASTTTRANFGLAQYGDDMVVIAGGTTSDDVLCIFDGRANGWKNATSLLAKKTISKSTVSSSSSASSSSSTSAIRTSTAVPSATSSTTATTTSEAAAATSSDVILTAPSSSLSANALLGVILGTVAGAGILLLALYMCLMRHRRKKQVAQGDNTGTGTSFGPASEKMMEMAINDLPRPNAGFRGHQTSDSAGSISSVGIMMGRVNQPRPPETRNNLVHATSLKGAISRPILQTGQDFATTANAPPRQMYEATNAYGRSVTAPRESMADGTGNNNNNNNTRRSSGWNRYWSGGSALNLLGFGSGQGRNSKRMTTASDASSNYSTNNLTNSVAGMGMGGMGGQGGQGGPTGTTGTTPVQDHRITQDSATVPPLEIPQMPEARPRFQRVNSGSPTIANYDQFMKQGGMMEGLQGTIERTPSGASSRSGYSSGIPASVHEAWDPTGASRSGSAADRQHGAQHGAWGSARAPSSAYGSSSTSPAPYTTATPASKKYVPSGMSQQPQLAMANTSNDMSWLNLGDVSRV